MPVFSVMAPVVHAQYPGGGGGGGTGALAGVGTGGRGAATSSLGPPGLLNREPNPLLTDEYEQALLRAVELAGYNPGSGNPNIQKVMQKGKQLVQELIAALSPTRGGNPALAESAPDMLNMLATLIKTAMTGGRVFGGAEKASALEGLMGLVNQYATGTTGSTGGDVLAQILGSPASASNLFQEVRYGNLAEPFQRAGAQSLIPMLNQFYKQQQANPEQTPNFLSMLLGLGAGASSAVGPLQQLPSSFGAGANPAATPAPGAAAAGLTPGAGAGGPYGLGTGGFPTLPGLPQAPPPQSLLPPPNPINAAAGLDPTQQLLQLAQGQGLGY